MLMQFCLLWTMVAISPPFHSHRECGVTRPDGQPVVVRLFAQEEWLPFEGTRWWVEVDGHSRRLDTFGFETNYGPIYQSPQGNQLIAFQTFRNTVQGGLCFDLVTGQVTEVNDKPATFEADGWKLRAWQPVGESK